MRPAPWLDRSVAVRFGGRPAARHRLLCVPYAGGGASVYRDWPALFPPWLEVVALRPAGREVRLAEPPLTSVPALVDDLVVHVAAVAAGPGSYSLFGHSLGAIVCFELARTLRRLGHPPPRHLFVSGRCAPHVPHGIADIAGLPDREFVDAVDVLGGVPAELFQANGLLEVVLPSLRADFIAAESYRYEADRPLDIPISAFGGSDDRTVSGPQLRSWRDQTAAGFSAHVLPGDHFFFRPQRGAVADAIRSDLGLG